MSKITILTYPNELLQQHCEQVKVFNIELRRLLNSMHKAMTAADGVGLAAPQIGLLKQIAIVENEDEEIIHLINPVILDKSGSQLGLEGCLSFPGLFGEVERPYYVKVRAQDKLGRFFVLEAEEYFARVILHEIDHLNGILFPSKAVTLYNE
ncbi:peptide deformylase [Bacillus sp. DJP31]|uniref:peptide deformylase n=1 Tax=Bacillus sp. DJP31 TaxID=3409789 RepID=UPI003BB60914